MRWVLVEATHRVLPEVDRDMGAYTVQQLMKRDMDIRLDTRLESCVDGVVQALRRRQLPVRHDRVDGRREAVADAGRDRLPARRAPAVTCLPTLQIVDGDRVVEGAWSAGDCAAVPDLTKEPGNFCSPSAQHAVRQAARMADNITAVIRGREPVNYKHKHVGSVASLGLHKGVAQVYGIKMTRLAGVVHAPDVPHEPDPVVQPQGPGGGRLDAGVRPQA